MVDRQFISILLTFRIKRFIKVPSFAVCIECNILRKSFDYFIFEFTHTYIFDILLYLNVNLYISLSLSIYVYGDKIHNMGTHPPSTIRWKCNLFLTFVIYRRRVVTINPPCGLGMSLYLSDIPKHISLTSHHRHLDCLFNRLFTWQQINQQSSALLALCEDFLHKGHVTRNVAMSRHHHEIYGLFKGLKCVSALIDTHLYCHDDVIKWKHFPRYWPFVREIHRSPVNSPHKGQWRGALMFSLICVWINGWVNNREAGDLRPHRAHYEVSVMWWCITHVAILPALKVRTICHAWDLWKVTWSCKQLRLLCPPDPLNLPGTGAVDFKAPGELWNPLSKTVLSKRNFILNKGHMNFWNDCKVQK